jgi:hypothetical protein
VYKEYFIAAKEYLQRQGMNPVLSSKRTVSEADINIIDQRTDWPMPSELRRFYVEMGDAFEFVPNDVPDSPLDGWEPNHLNDYAIWNQGFHTAIEEEVSRALASRHPQVDPGLLREQAEKRKKWIPFYGFPGGGDVVCLDSDGKVQFYQALEWAGSPDLCRGFVLADSFTDFVARWSKYSFVCPSRSGWTSFCWNQTGVFDWSATHFPQGVDRGNS